MTALEKIAQHEVFTSLSKEELHSVESLLSIQKFKKGDLLYDAAETPRFIFYISQGSFELQLPNNKRIELSEGRLIGEIGVINGNFRSGIAKALEDSSVIALCATRLFNEEFVPPRIALKILRALSKKITNYLRSQEQIASKDLLRTGENNQIEFKSSLRWNNHINKKDRAIENASLKTIVAFLNTDGGTLLIGVNDDAKILGLEADRFENHDRLLLHITQLVSDRIGAIYLDFINFSIESYDGKELLRVDCSPSKSPAYLDDGSKEHFYIRTGPATTDLSVSKVYPYIKQHFGE